ncbi:response regulator [Aggregatilinea lenta]|uniref:response regulator n=1 Tax=Aggregatilinea lenta TaxID=913108 RepID=UPI000E5AACB2|nr:response regulator [Aggregatilinea lenta]
MTSVPRIVIVDPARDIMPIVRGALALLNRQHILVDVPSAADVLDEVRRWPLDLVVTAYRVPGGRDGVELARRIAEISPETPVIVLADEGDRVLEPEALNGEHFQYYCRPVAEAFLGGLRAALDGEPVPLAEPLPVVADDERGPVPPIDLDEIRGIVRSVMRDTGAIGVLLADRTGRVLVQEGAVGQINPPVMAALLGPSFARVAEIGPLLGRRTWTMHYYDGERVDVYALALGLHHFMCLIVDNSNRGAMGSVTIFGRRAADRIVSLIGDAAYESTVLAAPQQQAEDVLPLAFAETAPVNDRVDELRDPFPVPDEIAPPEVPGVDLADDSFPTDFDADALFGQSVDETLANSLFSWERMGDIADTLESDDERRVDYNQARDLGLLDD